MVTKFSAFALTGLIAGLALSQPVRADANDFTNGAVLGVSDASAESSGNSSAGRNVVDKITNHISFGEIRHKAFNPGSGSGLFGSNRFTVGGFTFTSDGNGGWNASAGGRNLGSMSSNGQFNTSLGSDLSNEARQNIQNQFSQYTNTLNRQVSGVTNTVNGVVTGVGSITSGNAFANYGSQLRNGSQNLVSGYRNSVTADLNRYASTADNLATGLNRLTSNKPGTVITPGASAGSVIIDTP